MNPQIALPVDVRPEEVVRKHPLGGAIEPCVGDGGMSADINRAANLTPGTVRLTQVKTENDQIEAVLLAAMRAGAADMTYIEIRRAVIDRFGGDIYPGTVSARLSGLEAAERVLCDRENRRACLVTGKKNQVYSLPLVQVELGA